MSGVEPDARTPGLLGRVLNILLHPHDTWDIIEDEPASIEGLYRGWVLPLAAIPAVCRALGLLSFRGFEIFGVHYQPSLVTVLGDAVASYALTLIGVYVLALLVDQFAPQFGGERSRVQAFKLVVYAWTAAWVAGVFLLLPTAGGLFTLLGGLYSLYLLYIGLPKLMRSDPAQTLNYFFLTLVMAFIVAVLIGAVTSRMINFGGPIHIY
ncbi:Yip1 family protein [Phenylobacterium sp.]|uniref:Yip1 family protein n=1 Tax=Phenylobacterium sp. TaxID=1871053 RepID=UPI0011FA74EE|nr:Yip1 family protein [Phenylobacterium sp.]THD63820.1 MAG: YIP1 family protein [Phenylobacterium sp.]